MLNQEKIIETKTCKHCNSSFEITNKDLEFYEKVSPTFTGKKYIIPSPTLCPDCRQQRRLSFRNERKLYKRKCDATGENIISIYSPDKPYKVYNGDFWWSDKWDGLDYGKEFDFSKTSFEQFDKLMREVPKLSIVNVNSENSEYSSQGTYNKNCYLCFTTSYSENCLYSNFAQNTKYAVDCTECVGGEINYFCVNIVNCNKCFYSINSSNCYESYYLKNCMGCNFCFGCTNLVNKNYYINNKEFSPEEYFNELEKLKSEKRFLSNNNYLKTFEKGIHNVGVENVIGDTISNGKNSKYVFNGFDLEDCSFCYDIGVLKDCFDCNSFGHKCSKNLEIISGEEDNNCLFSYMIFGNNNLIYSNNCMYSSNLFGCIGLRNKSYCILNKQYSKEEYENLVPKIIEHMMKTGEWGEFFPSSFSPFGYNETVAQEYFPITPPSIPPLTGEGSKIFNFSLSPIRGKMSEGQIGVFNRSTYEPPFPKVDKIIKASMLPENISDIPDDILNWAIECEISGKPFRIIKAELDFYRKHNLPIPKKHPDQRHLDRLHLRNPRKLFDRKCDKCGKDIKTTYSPDRKEIVYCESCYEKEVY